MMWCWMIAEVFHRSDGWSEIRTPYDAEFVSALKQEIPPSQRAWVPDGRYWMVRTSLRRTILVLCHQYFGVVTEEEATTPPPPPGPGQHPDYGLLFLLPTAPLFVVEAVYRAIARAWHPDVCREPDATERMQRVNAAVDRIRQAAQR